jgi:hypothetical protein
VAQLVDGAPLRHGSHWRGFGSIGGRCKQLRSAHYGKQGM